jgi:hypothetical protein
MVRSGRYGAVTALLRRCCGTVAAWQLRGLGAVTAHLQALLHGMNTEAMSEPLSAQPALQARFTRCWRPAARVT